MVADVAPPADVDMDYEFSQGSILTCMCCGEYFVRHSSHQQYCDNPNCKAKRNNHKARAYYKKECRNRMISSVIGICINNVAHFVYNYLIFRGMY